PLYIPEEFWIASHPSHHEPAEEYSEDEPPAPCIPAMTIELFARRAILLQQKVVYIAPFVDQREHPFPEELEISLEFSAVDYSRAQNFQSGIPESPRLRRKFRAQFAVCFQSSIKAFAKAEEPQKSV